MVAELVIARTPSIFTFGREKKKKRPRTEPSRIPRERGASKNCDKARRRTKNQPRISTDSEVIKKN